jgi:prevent-host-death family protein
MTWNIAQAKQQFSEVVRLSAQEPQAIYNREKPVAALVNALEYEQFQQWRAQQQIPSLIAEFEELRNALHEAEINEIAQPDRRIIERANAFDQMLREELSMPSPRPRVSRGTRR